MSSYVVEQRQRLWSFLRRQFEPWRVLRGLAVGIPLAILGSQMLQYEVSNLHISDTWAYKLNWPLITALNFVFNYLIVWGDRDTERKEGALRWTLVSLGHTAISQSLYQILIWQTNIPYQGINWGLVVCMAPLSFMVNNLWTFVSRKAREQVIAVP